MSWCYFDPGILLILGNLYEKHDRKYWATYNHPTEF